jgi:hypothetical protein
MPADITIKQNDTYPPMRVTVSDSTGPIDLTGATVEIFFRRQATGVVFHGEASILDQQTNPGQAEYLWTPTDTATKGGITFEVRVTLINLRRMTFPKSGYFTLVITDDIDEAND